MTPIPKSVYYQLLNLVLTAGLLIYLLRTKVVDYFQSRRDDYLKLAEQVNRMKKDAENKRKDLQERFDTLERSEKQSIEKADREAMDLQQKLVNDATSVAQRIASDAQKTIQMEFNKSIAELKSDIIVEAMASSRENIQHSIKDSDQQRLQREFVEKIEVVEQ